MTTVDRARALAGWTPFLRRLVLLLIGLDCMTFETCRWCAALTSQDWEVLWPVLVLLRDVVALWAAAAPV